MNGWSCENCRLWERLYDGAKGGKCHRHAPRPTFNSAIDSDVLWPVTRENDYCWEFEHKVSLLTIKEEE